MALQGRTCTGKVVRRWRKRLIDPGIFSYERKPSYAYYLAIDDGHSDEAFALEVTEYQSDCLPVDTFVRITLDHKGLEEITEAPDTCVREPAE